MNVFFFQEDKDSKLASGRNYNWVFIHELMIIYEILYEYCILYYSFVQYYLFHQRYSIRCLKLNGGVSSAVPQAQAIKKNIDMPVQPFNTRCGRVIACANMCTGYWVNIDDDEVQSYIAHVQARAPLRLKRVQYANMRDDAERRRADSYSTNSCAFYEKKSSFFLNAMARARANMLQSIYRDRSPDQHAQATWANILPICVYCGECGVRAQKIMDKLAPRSWQ